MVLTMGAGKKSPEELIKRFEFFSINKVWDIRTGVVASYFESAMGTSFDAKVKAAGMEYRRMDLKLGREACLKRQDDFFQYMDELKQSAADCNLLILGNQEDPTRCVRGLVIGRELKEDILHVLKTGTSQTQEQLEMSLVEKRFPDREQYSIFGQRPLAEMVATVYEEALAKV